jgi:hypothetical protein
MASRKKRPSLKSDAATQFLHGFLERGPKTANEVQNAAYDNGISIPMLAKVSQSIVTKTQKIDSDGVRKWYWKLRTSQRRVARSFATERTDAAAFSAGYQRAVTDMLLRLANIDGGSGRKLTAKQLTERFYAELRRLKDQAHGT